ncbi:two-component regulator propeller domain-containing protein [Chitinophaga pinensis]|uniref:PorZ N-terminal beta-propeller domain-containing protein n=1 Tax=Chitinophaga pinensis TaxID=79329 RepID=A0A5C6LYQ3_9BACT|nr:two-component regulator propeller domain-containing protein [Chitinophaga pinensis]TWW01758.1 hypothetical protein FEF09_04130 [Chitinophaga pinensis]
MYRFLISLCTILCLSCLNALQISAQQPGEGTYIGQWSDHLPWRPAVAVTVKGDKIYCAAAGGLTAVTNTPEEGLELSRYSKVNGLHDIGITTLAANDETVLVAYSNSNIDLLGGNTIYNIPDLMRKQVAADKTIFKVVFRNNKAYLCTGLGIVVLNTSVPEIEATYVVGNTGAYKPVYSLAIIGTSLFAATSEGVKTTSLNSNNPSDFRNWSSLSQGLAPDSVQDIIVFNNQLICRQHNQLFLLRNNIWTLWYTADRIISNMSVHDNQLLLCQPQTGGSRILALNNNAAAAGSFQHTLLKAPVQVAGNGNTFWIADSLSGLVQYDRQTNEYTAVNPDAPAGIITGDMLFSGRTLLAAPGTINSNWKAAGNREGYYSFENGTWNTVSGWPDSLHDIATIAIDPGALYLGSFGGGLARISGNKMTVFKQGILPAATNDPTGYNVSGLATDLSGNLWVAVYGAGNNLLVKKPDDTWVSFRSPYAMTGNAISQLLTDDNGLVYIVSPLSNGLYVFSHNNTPDNKSDDQWRQYRLGAAQGNLPSNDVYCLAKDRNGSIWIGTARGIAIINCPGQAATEGCNAILPVIQQDNFAGYLFQDEQVTTIAVDGANRKWVGTYNGAWLVSDDGQRILEHFNTGNSPLPDNHIYRITIDPKVGEVYFATGKGLMSWHGTATEPVSKMERDSVLVFPNPVKHDYSGPIAIRGLADNTRVKITDISGRMVYQTRAFGGQAIWNGLDYTGHRPQSGVYLVFAMGETGGEHVVTRIVFIN